MLTNQALDSLRKWLGNNDKYSHLLSNRRSQATTDDSRLLDEYVLILLKNFKSNIYIYISFYIEFSTAFEELQELFLQAVSLSTNPNDIDSDLQVKKNISNNVFIKNLLIYHRYVLVYCFIYLAIMIKQLNVSIQPFLLNPM